VARNRKRAKERRARRPQPVATTHADRDDATPGPISHAAPDVELAEAQLALGRPDLAGESANDAELAAEAADDAEQAAEAADADEQAAEAADVDEPLDQEFGEGPDIPGVLPEGPRLERGELERVEAPVPEARAGSGNRLINFLQGSWRELQRVQWPDRRQVMQATGVVIGFVIVAGVFLGVADLLATKIVNFILK
jgi:preprotein translocase subunit SecE